MKNDLKEMINSLLEKGYTSREFMILYSLSCRVVFEDLDENDLRKLCDKAYSEYLRNDFMNLEEVIDNVIKAYKEGVK